MSTKPDLLFQAYLDGDKEGFAPLVNEMTPRVFGFFVRLGAYPQDAEDLCQEFFTSLMRSAATFEPGRPFLPWAYRIARNIHVKFSSRRSRLNVIPFNEWAAAEAENSCLPGGGHSSDPAGAIETRDRIDGLLSALTPEKREVLVLRHFQELSFQEISQVLGIPEGTAKSRMFSALIDLRSAAAKEDR